jgi:hypothetical protein
MVVEDDRFRMAHALIVVPVHRLQVLSDGFYYVDFRLVVRDERAVEPHV